MNMPLSDSYLAGFRAAFRHDHLPRPAARGIAGDAMPANGVGGPRGAAVIDQAEGGPDRGEALLKMRQEIEQLLEECGLSDEIRGKFLKKLDEHVSSPPAGERQAIFSKMWD
jgi:hypothetical protein